MGKARRKMLSRKAKDSVAARVIEPPGPKTEYDTLKLGDVKFEELCCAMLHAESHLKEVDLYGRPRQHQHGIDVIGTRKDGTGVEVVSCKCYQGVKKGEIEKFVDEFLDHWKKIWKGKRVRRFVLAITVDLRAHERRAEIEEQRVRLKKHKVVLEIWSKRNLGNKIRLSAALRRDFYRYWDDADQLIGLKGMSSINAQGTNASLSAIGSNHIQGLQAAFADSVSGLLDKYAEQWRKGQATEVAKALSDIRRIPSRWKVLTPEVRARVLRMQSLVALRDKDTKRASALLSQADKLSASGGKRFRALVINYTRGAKDALKAIGTAETKEDSLLLAALQLECGKGKDAERTLRQWESSAKSDPEWRRLMACCAILNGRPSFALGHIKRAEELGPEWKTVKRFGAIIRYANALSAAANFKSFRIPEPNHLSLVKRDDESQGLLLEALSMFKELRSEEVDENERRELDVWILASLENLNDKESAVRNQLRRMLEVAQPSVPALFWALTRQQEFSKQKIERKLEARLRSPKRSIDDLQALLACRYADSKLSDASTILDKYADKFSDESEKKVIEAWRIRLEPTSVTKGVDEKGEPFVVLDRLVINASKAKKWDAIERFLGKQKYRADLLMAASQALAAHDQWQIVAKYSDRLLCELENDAAVRLVAYAKFNTNAFGDVLLVLDDNVSVFPGGKLPEDLERLRAYASVRHGNLLQARALAVKLARQTGKPRDQLFAAQLHIKSGDIAGALPFIRGAIAEGNLQPSELIALIPKVYSEDAGLARTLMEKALTKPIGADVGGVALEWAYKLGMQSDAHRIAAQVFANQDANSPVLEPTDIEKVKDILRHRQETLTQTTDRYLRGEAPIHFIAKIAGINLARFWDSAFGSDTAFGAKIRSGNRATDFFPGGYPASVSLHIDITGLLSAEWIGILDVLEKSDVSLELPASIIDAIEHLEADAHHHQPSRIETMKAVVAYASSHPGVQIETESFNSLDQAVAKAAFELRSDDGLTDRDHPRVCLGAIACELVSTGKAADSLVQSVCATLSGWQSEESEVDISKIRTLMFSDNSIDSVVDAGLLPAIESRFNVRIAREYLESCNAEIQEAARRAKVAQRLQALRKRLAVGISSSRYKLLATESEISEAVEDQADVKNNVVARPLLDALMLPAVSGRLLWIDDRFTTSYTAANGNIIVSTYEVLRYLLSRNLLTKEAFFDHLQSLRNARFDYIPIVVDEVDYWLRLAEIREGAIVESPALASIRTSQNRLLSNEEYLDLNVSDPKPERISEISALVGGFRLARLSIERIWDADDLSIEKKVFFSEWIWDSLRVEYLKSLPPNSNAKLKIALLHNVIVQLLIGGLSIRTRSADNDGSPREEYFKWLSRQLLDLRYEGSDEAHSGIATNLWQSFEKMLRDVDTYTEEDASPDEVRQIFNSYVTALPLPIRLKVRGEPSFEELIRPGFKSVVTIGEFRFIDEAFWETLESVWNEVGDTIETFDGTVVKVRRDSNDFLFERAGLIHFVDPDFSLLDRDPAKRLEHLKGSADDLVGDATTIEAIAKDTVAPELPATRMRAARERRSSTARGRYSIVSSSLASGRGVLAENLLPAASSVQTAFLGIDQLGEGADNLEHIAARLVERVGISEALRRWAGLPLRIPPAMLAAVRALDARARRLLFDELRPEAITPLRRLRFLELLVQTNLEPESDQEIDIAIQHLAASWREDASAFCAVLRWSERAFRRDESWYALPKAQRLACIWAHADQIMASFKLANFTSQLVRDRFQVLQLNSYFRAFPIELEFDSDISAPRYATPETILLYGLNVALGGNAERISSERRKDLLRLLMQQQDSGELPSVHLLEDRRFGRNALRSYLSGVQENWFEGDLVLADRKILSAAGRDSTREETIQQLESNPSDGFALVLLHMVGPQWFSPSDRARLGLAVQRMDELPHGNGDGGYRGLSELADIAPHFDEETRNVIRQSLLKWARQLSKIHKGPIFVTDSDGEAERVATSIIELAFSLERHEAIGTAYVGLSRALRNLVQAWPSLAQRIRGLISHILSESPSDAYIDLWHLYVELRAVK
jgi:hypothetical protein